MQMARTAASLWRFLNSIDLGLELDENVLRARKHRMIGSQLFAIFLEIGRVHANQGGPVILWQDGRVSPNAVAQDRIAFRLPRCG